MLIADTKSEPTFYRNIIVALLGGIGDVIMFSPCLRALRSSCPQSRITLLLAPGVQAELVERAKIDELITHDTLVALPWRLRRRRFDLFIATFQINPLKAALLAQLAGIPMVIGESQAPGSGFRKSPRWLTRCYHRRGREHCLDINRGIVELIGVPVTDTGYYFPMNDEPRRAAVEFMRRTELPDSAPVIGIHPGSTAALAVKRWPRERYAEIIKALSERGLRCLLLGGPDETGLCEELVRAAPGTITSAGIFNLFTTAALIERCALVVGNDSGLMKIAEALQVPTVSLWGPTHPELTGPYDRSRHTVIYHTHDCSPCFNYPAVGCARPYCLEDITVAEVLTAIAAKIRNR